MSRAAIIPLMSLDQYAEILGSNPLFFNQGRSQYMEPTAGCNQIWYQHEWAESGHASREELAQGLAQAEQLVAQLTGFWSAPSWVAAEPHIYPKQRITYGPGARTNVFPGAWADRAKTVQAKWRKTIALGRRAVELIEAGVPVDYTDEDEDDFDETATMLSVYTGSGALSSAEIAILPAGETDWAYEIRHARRRLTGTAISIVGHSSHFFVPALWERPEPIDADDTDSFLTEVDLYRVYTTEEGDANAPVEFRWLRGYQETVDYGTGRIWEPEQGIIVPLLATWDDTDEEWQPVACSYLGEPDQVRLYYRAGWPLDARAQMAPPFARAVAALATALITKPICGCGQDEALAARWQAPPAEDEQIAYERLRCPWGTAGGAWEAYAMLSKQYGGVGASNL